MIVPNDALHGCVRFPQVPELNESIFCARHQAEWFVGIVIQVSHREIVRSRHRSSGPAEEVVGGQKSAALRVIFRRANTVV